MFRRKHRVRFEESLTEPPDAEFNAEFTKYNSCSLYMILVFLMTCAVQFCIQLDGMMLRATQDSEVSCVTAAYRFENYTKEEMIKLTYPELRSTCMHFKYDRAIFENKSFAEAEAIVEKMEHREYTSCSEPIDYAEFTWDQSLMGTCNSFPYKLRLYTMLNVGSSIGYIVVGIIADLYGRKTGFYLSLTTWSIGILCLPVSVGFVLTLFINVIKGFGKAGLSLTSIILFLELANKHYRGILTIYVTCFGPIAQLVGIILKHHLDVNIKLKYTMTLPSIILVFYAWYMPESPKWYLSYSQKKKAWKVLERLGTDIESFVFLPPLKFKTAKVFKENLGILFSTIKYRKCLLLCTFLLTFIKKIGSSKKLYITLREVRVTSHCHLIILAEIGSFMYVLPPFIILGRHLALCWFVMLTLVQLCISLILSYKWIYIFNILIVLAIHALDMIMVLYISEIFPTCARCTSAGFIHGLATVFFLSHSLFEEIAVSDYATENRLFILYSVFGLILLSTLPNTGAYELPDHKRYRNDIQQQKTTDELNHL